MSSLHEHETSAAPAPAVRARPAPVGRASLWRLFGIWLALGLQSFGGGSATLFLIRRAAVEQQRWLSDEEFTRDWAICQIAPGINLLCLTTLLGRRVYGTAGIFVALAGLLLPSVAITVLLTAIYAEVQRLEVVEAARRGVIPATVALGWLTGVQMARPLLVASRHEGWYNLAISLALLAGSGVAALVLDLPVLAMLLGFGAIGAIAYRQIGAGRVRERQP